MITMVATKEKKFVQIEIGDDVKKLTIEGVDKDQQVVMREEISDKELEQVASGLGAGCPHNRYYLSSSCPRKRLP